MSIRLGSKFSQKNKDPRPKQKPCDAVSVPDPYPVCDISPESIYCSSWFYMNYGPCGIWFM